MVRTLRRPAWHPEVAHASAFAGQLACLCSLFGAAICWLVHHFQLLQRSAGNAGCLCLLAASVPQKRALLPGDVVFLILIFHVLVQHGGIPARGAGRSAE